MKKIIYACAALLALSTSCLSNGDETIILEGGMEKDAAGIPDDKYADPNPSIEGEENGVVPNPTTTVDVTKGEAYAILEMNGIWNPVAEEWLMLYGTGDSRQNVWVSIDDTPKGIDVYNNGWGDKNHTIIDDVVFLVDNSDSMAEEADAIAGSILSWAESLTRSGIDLRVGCVGYGGTAHAISGALDMSKPSTLSAYLDKYTGTDRTKYFAGTEADRLEAIAVGSDRYENGAFYESGVLALRFATDAFTFRRGANRIFVNFTDEANQPNGDSNWSVDYLNPSRNLWTAAMGTVHTVFSNERQDYNKPLYEENPWLMSTYTGGTVIFTDPAFTGFTLDNLPVTGSMQHSYIIRVGHIEPYLDEQLHNVKITIKSADGGVCAERVFRAIFRVAE